MQVITLCVFSVFIGFQLLYIFIPLLTYKRNRPTTCFLREQGITVLVPAFNETNVIKNCIQGAVVVNYSNHEVIVINDGSTDDTLNTLTDFLKLAPITREINPSLSYKPIIGLYQSAIYENVFVIDKINGGKADALNAGIDYANNDIIITLDADSILEFNSLKAINSGFHADNVIAVGGTVHIIQGIKSDTGTLTPTFNIKGLIRFQIIQYLTSFYLHKYVQAQLGALTVIAGAFGGFRKSTLLKLQGFRNTVGEDMDITLRIQRLIHTKEKDKKIEVIPEALCFTECPENLRDLFKQRIRWQKAFIDCLFAYSHSLFNQFSFSMSLFFLLEGFMLGNLVAFNTLLVPLVLLVAQTGFSLALLLFTISFACALCQGFVALVVCKRFGHTYSLMDLIRILVFLPLEIVSYRLLGLIWVTLGTVAYFSNKHHWNKSARYGKTYQLGNSSVKIEL